MKWLTIIAAMVLLVAQSSVIAGEAVSYEKTPEAPLALDALTIDNSTYINANQILMFVNNTGGFGCDLDHVLSSGYANSGTFYPYVSNEFIEEGILNRAVLYASGLWIGGKVNDSLRVTASDYHTEYVPGPMSGGTYLPDDPSFRVYKLYRDSLGDNPNADYLNWPVSQGAPVDGEGKPRMFGDQMLWSVFNDADPAAHTVQETAPLGIEVQQTVWATQEDGTDTIPGPTGIIVIQKGSSTVQVTVEIVDTAQLTSHDYQVVLDSLVGTGEVWSLIDVTTSTTVLSDQTNFAGDNTSPIVDGMRIKVFYPPPGLADWQWTGSERTLTGVNWGGTGFFGGIGLLDQFYVSDLTRTDVRYVEIRWVGEGNGQNAYLYNRSNSYAYEGFFPQDFEVWDVTPGSPERQINFAFVENNWPAPHTPPDSLWDPGIQLDNVADTSSHDAYGGREYFQIMNSDYSVTPLPDYEVNAWFTRGGGSSWDVLYGGWLARRDSTDGQPSTGDVFLLVPEEPVFPADTFTFTGAPWPAITTGPEGVSIYIAYKLYNRGSNTIDSCYVSLWADCELGGVGDNKLGCDSLTNIFYCYNGDNDDPVYGARPPAVGFKYLYGPLVPSPGNSAVFDGETISDYSNLGMTACEGYFSDADPDYPQAAYNYMRGILRDGSPYVYNGDTITYRWSGDPVTGNGDVDPFFSTYLMMASCGPFTFNPGDSQYVLIKMAVGQGEDNLSSITNMREILNMPFEFPTGVDDGSSKPELPERFALGQNYPNPFNPSTRINYWLPQRAHVEIDIFNILGQRVTTLVNAERAAGAHSAEWNGTDGSGNRVSTGIYLYRIKAGDFVESKKMLLLK